MDYNKAIQIILEKFNETFNTNYNIVFDTRENILNSNKKFSFIGDGAGGFYDGETRNIYIFSNLIDKINSINYDNSDNSYDNGLTFLIYACFHELQHRLQKEHPEKLRLQPDFANEIYTIETFILVLSSSAPELIEIDYKESHDKFFLEIDADAKGVHNAIEFSKAYGLPSINFRYYKLLSLYNNYRIQTYDIFLMVNQFLKLANKYKSRVINIDYLPNKKILNYFDENGNLKSIDDIMKIQDSSILKYIISSPEFLKTIDQKKITMDQCKFITNCIKNVLNEHYLKKSYMEQNKERMCVVTAEKSKYTQTSSRSSKNSDPMATEKYYMYLQAVLKSLQEMQFGER